MGLAISHKTVTKLWQPKSLASSLTDRPSSSTPVDRFEAAVRATTAAKAKTPAEQLGILTGLPAIDPDATSIQRLAKEIALIDRAQHAGFNTATLSMLWATALQRALAKGPELNQYPPFAAAVSQLINGNLTGSLQHIKEVFDYDALIQFDAPDLDGSHAHAAAYLSRAVEQEMDNADGNARLANLDHAVWTALAVAVSPQYSVDKDKRTVFSASFDTLVGHAQDIYGERAAISFEGHGFIVAVDALVAHVAPQFDGDAISHQVEQHFAKRSYGEVVKNASVETRLANNRALLERFHPDDAPTAKELDALFASKRSGVG